MSTNQNGEPRRGRFSGEYIDPDDPDADRRRVFATAEEREEARRENGDEGNGGEGNGGSDDILVGPPDEGTGPAPGAGSDDQETAQTDPETGPDSDSGGDLLAGGESDEQLQEDFEELSRAAREQRRNRARRASEQFGAEVRPEEVIMGSGGKLVLTDRARGRLAARGIDEELEAVDVGIGDIEETDEGFQLTEEFLFQTAAADIDEQLPDIDVGIGDIEETDEGFQLTEEFLFQTVAADIDEQLPDIDVGIGDIEETDEGFQLTEAFWGAQFDEAIESRDITREDLVFGDEGVRLKQGVEFQLERDIAEQFDEAIPGMDIDREDLVFGEEGTRLKKGIEFQLERDIAEEFDAAITGRDITREDLVFGEEGARLKEGVEFKLEQDIAGVFDPPEVPIGAPGLSSDDVVITPPEQRSPERAARTDIARELDIDPRLIDVDSQVTQALEEVGPRATAASLGLQREFDIGLDPQAQRELIARDIEGAEPEDVELDPERGIGTVAPEQERIFGEGSILGDFEDRLAPDAPITFQRESRPEQLLELSEARFLEEIDQIEDFLSDMPTLGAVGPGLQAATVTDDGADPQSELQAGAISEGLRLTEPAGIGLLATDIARTGRDVTIESARRKPDAFSELIDAGGPLDAGAAAFDVISPIGTPTLEQTTSAGEQAIEVAPDLAADIQRAFRVEPVRTTGRTVGAVGALAVPSVALRGGRTVGRAARGRGARSAADDPLKLQTDLPPERPVTLRVEDVDVRAAAMRGEGSPTSPLTTQSARETRAARRSEGPLPALEEIREAGGLPWWVRDVGERIDDIDIESRVGAGLVPPKITRRSGRTTDPAERLDREVLSGSPRDLMSEEITERALTQRRQLGGDFEGATDPIAGRPGRRAQAEEDLARIGIEEVTEPIATEPGAGAISSEDLTPTLGLDRIEEPTLEGDIIELPQETFEDITEPTIDGVIEEPLIDGVVEEPLIDEVVVTEPAVTEAEGELGLPAVTEPAIDEVAVTEPLIDEVVVTEPAVTEAEGEPLDIDTPLAELERGTAEVVEPVIDTTPAPSRDRLADPIGDLDMRVPTDIAIEPIGTPGISRGQIGDPLGDVFADPIPDLTAPPSRPGRPRRIPPLEIPELDFGGDRKRRRRDPFETFAKEIEFDIGDPLGDIDLDLDLEL